MDPLYHPGLDENRAVDDLYAEYVVKNVTASEKNSSGVEKMFNVQ